MRYYRMFLVYLLPFMMLLLASCGGRQKTVDKQKPSEDKTAKRLLQGIWMNSDDESAAFKASGDTIYYPDTLSQPVYFQIFGDTLVLKSANVAKYKIVKQSAHVFQFKNAAGDLVSLYKSDNPDDASFFTKKHPLPMNQGKLIKRDSVLIYGNEHYHSYVQINPTTYKVVKATYSDDGVEVDNVYYDNIIHVSVFRGNYRLFSKDFHKSDFASKVPASFLSQSILSDITLMGMDTKGTHFLATIVIPDSQSSFLVEIIVDYRGRLRLVVNN